jgi:hypothetical protein
MIEDDAGTVRKVEWTELCPWLILFRCFRMAIGFRLLLLATAGALVTVIGWMLILWVFSGDPRIEALSGDPWSALTGLVPDAPGFPQGAVNIFDDTGTSVVDRSSDPFLGTWRQLSRPFRQVFGFPVVSGNGAASNAGGGCPMTNMACFLLCGLWGLAVWAFLGGAITRSAAVELACEERIGFGQMIGYARSRWKSYVGAPLLPLVIALLIACAIAVPGLALRADIPRVLVAIIWPLLLVGGVSMTLLLLGLFFGWPLMFAATSVEGADAFDAVSHSYAYTFQRPWRYLFYAAVAVVLGTLGWLVVSNVAAATVGLTYWAASLGGGATAVGEVIGGGLGDNADSLGCGLIRFWCGCVKLLAVGFLYSYFWIASTAIYLLLRLDNDNKEMDEIFLDDDEDEPPHALPSLTTDAAGAPVAVDEVDLEQEE